MSADVSINQRMSADSEMNIQISADISRCSGCQYFREKAVQFLKNRFQYFQESAFYRMLCNMGEMRISADISGSIYQRYINQRIRYSGPHQSATPMHGPESIDRFHAETSVSGADKQAPVNQQAQYRDPHQSADWIQIPKFICEIVRVL